VSWEFPANFHLAAGTTADLSFEPRRLTPLKEAPRAAQRVGAGPIFPAQRYWAGKPFRGALPLASFGVEIAERAFRVGGIEFPAGSWICPRRTVWMAPIHSVASELGLDSLA